MKLPTKHMATRIRQRFNAELADLRAKVRAKVDDTHVLATTDNIPDVTWSDDLPLPFTVADAFKVLEKTGDDVVSRTVEHIVACARALVGQEFFAAVLNQNSITARWPLVRFTPTDKNDIPSADLASWHTRRCLDALAGPRTADGQLVSDGIHEWDPSDEAHEWDPSKPRWPKGYWPAEVAPLEVARWAQVPLNAMVQELGTLALDAVNETGVFPALRAEWNDGSRLALPAVCVGLLYLAEQATIHTRPAAFNQYMMAVDRPPVRAITAMVGADWRDIKEGSTLRRITRPDDPSEPTALKFTWDDGQAYEAQLELPLTPSDLGPLLAVAHKYGDATVRDLLALYAFAWAARAPAGGSFWWWPDEHLELVGLAQTAENRAQVLRRMKALSRASMTAHYKTGAPLTGPLVAMLETDGRAYRLHKHAAMYRGVTKEDGTPGNYWWLTPVGQLRMPADRTAGKVHVLGPVLGSFWVPAMKEAKDGRPTAKIGCERLASYLGIEMRSRGQAKDRQHDRRAGETLRRTMDAGMRSGLVESWTVEGGEVDLLTGNMIATPSETAMQAGGRGALHRPARVPATGDDLARWMDDSGMTSDMAGQVVGVPGPSLRRLAQSHRGRPLPHKVRQALRRHLWPGGAKADAVHGQGGVRPSPITGGGVSVRNDSWEPNSYRELQSKTRLQGR